MKRREEEDDEEEDIALPPPIGGDKPVLPFPPIFIICLFHNSFLFFSFFFIKTKNYILRLGKQTKEGAE